MSGLTFFYRLGKRAALLSKPDQEILMRVADRLLAGKRITITEFGKAACSNCGSQLSEFEIYEMPGKGDLKCATCN